MRRWAWSAISPSTRDRSERCGPAASGFSRSPGNAPWPLWRDLSATAIGAILRRAPSPPAQRSHLAGRPGARALGAGEEIHEQVVGLAGALHLGDVPAVRHDDLL